jgi:nucleoside-diphosphate-sugar epimerase
MPTYSISKIAAETVARFGARQFELPTTIARLNVPYGDGGGWPAFHLALMQAGQPIEVHPDGARYNPIDHRDIVRLVPALLDVADVSAPIVNLAGDDVVSIEEWCRYLGQLAGCEPTFTTSEDAIPSAVIDTTRQHELVGGCEIAWRDGFREIVAALHPELLP